MGKLLIRVIIFFIAVLIMTIIGNTICTPSQSADNTISAPHLISCSKIQEPQSLVEKTIQHLFTQNHTDIPNRAIIIQNINTYDFKSILRNVINIVVYYNITEHQSFACFNHPPINKRITYYIYTLEKILI